MSLSLKQPFEIPETDSSDLEHAESEGYITCDSCDSGDSGDESDYHDAPRSIITPEALREAYTWLKLAHLPKEIRNKICIQWYRNYWRNYLPLTAQTPTWMARKVAVDRELFESRRKNIHFMHLSFNTLPESKKWIPGCQCDYCIDPKVQRKSLYRILFLQLQYEPFGGNIAYTPFHQDMRYYVESLEDPTEIETILNDPGLKENISFDFFWGSQFEDSTMRNLRENEYPFTFSSS